MPTFFTHTLAIFQKDLKTEWRTKERLSAMTFFAFLVILIFNFAFEPGSPIMQSAAPGIFWIATTFAGLMGLGRAFAIEKQNDCLLGLRLTPADPGAIFLGKMLGNMVAMLLLEALILPILVIFLDVEVFAVLPRLCVPIFLGTLGFAAVGTLFAAMSMNTRLQEALLPILTLPVLVPALLAAVESFRGILEGDTLSDIFPWLKLGGAFAGLFGAACLLLFEFVLED
ncbi:MAG: transcriptional regulator [Candidatus Latescibacteria bacterium]|jgi:heme exporter protein B|nr:transcriptional regulator [Candidatus Latescibacterota bacterium]MBT4138030.1 transcriptional regulator [Candidatus Latescibacterota bacterium]MBT5829679.1 transcriptional regulator [Candidatus Latescibacterota bacterium]